MIAGNPAVEIPQATPDNQRKQAATENNEADVGYLLPGSSATDEDQCDESRRAAPARSAGATSR